jgi:deazaflavin-dependent oxidoreductase (nitroreductase family)
MARKIKKPNAFQKLLHRIVMIRPVTAFFAPWIHRLDKTLLELTKGKHSAAEILGWPIVEITTIGAKTGQPRTVPLVSVVDGETIALIASSFGREHNPGWYYNLKAHPQCEVHFNGRTAKHIARQLEGEEREKYWDMAVAYYKGYELYAVRAAHRQIPVMVLEPIK